MAEGSDSSLSLLAQTRAKAVRLVLEHRDHYPSEWAVITAVSIQEVGNDRRDFA